MIADLLQEVGGIVEANASQTMDEMYNATWDAVNEEIDKPSNGKWSLPDGAAAQWSAGFLYGASGQTEDYRDYLAGCAKNCPIVNRKMSKAYKWYNADDWRQGNEKL